MSGNRGVVWGQKVSVCFSLDWHDEIHSYYTEFQFGEMSLKTTNNAFAGRGNLCPGISAGTDGYI